MCSICIHVCDCCSRYSITFFYTCLHKYKKQRTMQGKCMKCLTNQRLSITSGYCLWKWFHIRGCQSWADSQYSTKAIDTMNVSNIEKNTWKHSRGKRKRIQSTYRIQSIRIYRRPDRQTEAQTILSNLFDTKFDPSGNPASSLISKPSKRSLFCRTHHFIHLF